MSADHALHREVMTRADLDAAMVALRPWRWSREPATMLALVDGRAESGAESRTRWALRTLGLRMPTPQVEIFDNAGQFVARVDFLYEDIRLVIEVVRLTWADLDDLTVVRAKIQRGLALAA